MICRQNNAWTQEKSFGRSKVLIETGRFVEDQATEARLNQKKKMGDTSSSREGMGFRSKENADHARQAKIMMGEVKGI